MILGHQLDTQLNNYGLISWHTSSMNCVNNCTFIFTRHQPRLFLKALLVPILFYISIVINNFWTTKLFSEHYNKAAPHTQISVVSIKGEILVMSKNTAGYVILDTLVSVPLMSKYTYGGWEFFRFFVCTLYIFYLYGVEWVLFVIKDCGNLFNHLQIISLIFYE